MRLHNPHNPSPGLGIFLSSYNELRPPTGTRSFRCGVRSEKCCFHLPLLHSRQDAPNVKNMLKMA
jgi:hypothetical protein